MKSYKNIKKQLLKNREVKKSYDELEGEFNVVRLIIKKRIETGITQAELAQKIGTKQSAISRLESGEYNPTLSFLCKITEALGSQICISIKDKQATKKR